MEGGILEEQLSGGFFLEDFSRRFSGTLGGKLVVDYLGSVLILASDSGRNLQLNLLFY